MSIAETNYVNLRQDFTYLGYLFRVLHDDPQFPETSGKFVSEIFHAYRWETAMELSDDGFYARVLGLFSNVGEAITAAKREIEYMRHGRESKS